MSLTSYGAFGKLPREIRDMIYLEYFSVDSPSNLEKYLAPLGQSNPEAIFYITEPDTGLLRTSRALYMESQPLWKNYCQGHKLFRVAANASNRGTARKDIVLTLSAKTLPKPPPFTRSMHITWLSYRWLHNPRLYRAVNSGLERARIVFPNLQYFLRTDYGEIIRSMELFARIIRGCSWRVPGRLNIFIEDAKWPLPQPGERVWYKRLHQGMTRRSLIKSRESQLDVIIRQLNDIIYQFQKLVAVVTFTFGDTQNGRYRDNTGEVRRIVSTLQKKVEVASVSIEYM